MVSSRTHLALAMLLMSAALVCAIPAVQQGRARIAEGDSSAAVRADQCEPLSEVRARVSVAPTVQCGYGA